jgi:hypothetical protein
MMLIAQTKLSMPTSVTVAIWSLRSVPISMLVLMFVFNSGSVVVPIPSLHFWLDAIAICGIVAIVTFWNHLQRSHWNTSVVIYLYISLILILRNPYKILNAISDGNVSIANWHSIVNSFWVGAGILALGVALEVLIFHLRQLKAWTWWISLSVSMLYVCSIVFFFSGTLGIWSLLDTDTKQAFKRRMALEKYGSSSTTSLL